MTNPVPVPPPAALSADIETTDGSTRWAISATEPGGRSIDVLTEDNLISWPKSEPEELAPKTAPTKPAIAAINKAFERVTNFALPCEEDGTHQGPVPIGSLMSLSFYNFVASNKPSPRGISEVTHLSVSPLSNFPASRRAMVFGSRIAGSLTFAPPKKLSMTKTPPLRRIR